MARGKELVGHASAEVKTNENLLDSITRHLEALKANDKIFLPGCPITTRFFDFMPMPNLSDQLVVNNTDIIVAPKKPIYDNRELIIFAGNLITNIKPTNVPNPNVIPVDSDGGISIPVVKFSEPLGTLEEKRGKTIKTDRPEEFWETMLSDSEKIIVVKQLVKTISLWILPDPLSSQIAFAYAYGAREQQSGGQVLSQIDIKAGHPSITGRQINFLKSCPPDIPLSNAAEITEKLMQKD